MFPEAFNQMTGKGIEKLRISVVINGTFTVMCFNFTVLSYSAIVFGNLFEFPVDLPSLFVAR